MITQLVRCLSAALLAFALVACGLKGPLYMPPAEQPQNQEAQPAQAPTDPSDGQQSAPQTPAESTPEAAPHSS
ncbi:lipoprotein [Aeromonas bivalvium]|uniref:Lipoprotein n=1 Tax=Aeromonas bivalvium TaxID=440079 RepID=A0ABW9GTG6_9GAMM